VESTGHALGSAPTELPPAVLQQCTPEGCSIQQTQYRDGLGLERTDAAPELFGTFTFGPDMVTLSKNKNHIELNRLNEYGRNTSSRWADLY
jgi:hypothetical protein